MKDRRKDLEEEVEAFEESEYISMKLEWVFMISKIPVRDPEGVQAVQLPGKGVNKAAWDAWKRVLKTALNEKRRKGRKHWGGA